MGIALDIEGPAGWHAALAALAWQIELGATEAISETPVNAYEFVTEAPKVAAASLVAQAAVAEPAAVAVDAVAVARDVATGARTLDDLRDALAGFDLLEIKRGARNLVFSDGRPGARVMILGEAPGRDEDMEGLPFVGRAGQLLDLMFGAIGLSRRSPDTETALYITNVLPWRPPQNREPTSEEIAIMRPFLERHIALADPDVIVVMGNTPCAALLNLRGITRLRGQWTTALGRPVLPMTHPAYLLRTPSAKREAWADLLALQARLRG